MSRVLMSIALIASLAPQAQCGATAARAAWAWAKAEPDQCHSSAALAWSTAKPTEPTGKTIEPPTTTKLTSYKGWHYPKANEISEPGNHWHRCDCGRVCQHASDSKGDLAAHTCVCGRVNFDKSEGVPITLSNCPNGNCPKR